MADKPLPDRATLLKYLRYVPDTGELFWLPRSDHRSEAERLSNIGFNKHFANKKVGGKLLRGYLRFHLLGGSYFAHRLIWCMFYGEWPVGEIDHINRCKSDNRIANLRLVSRSENARNASLSSRNTSGATGVFSHKGKWVARIYHNGRMKQLGTFSTFEAARAAREKANEGLGFSAGHGSPRP